MKLPFKISSTVATVLICNCLNSIEYKSDDYIISKNEKSLIRKFAVENGYSETMPLDSFVRYVYRAWPNESVRKDFFLTFPKQNAIPRTLVLSDVLTSLGKSLRVHYEPAPYGGTISSAIIDSINIITDSIINFPGLNLSFCNLTHLPKEIGKLRVQKMNIGSNKIKDLPLEIMSIFNHLHPDTGSIGIAGNPIDKGYWDSIPDTLRNWLIKHP